MEEIFVARQPIFDRHQKVYAYELLYRSSANTFFSALGGDEAASEVITNSFLLIGLETLTRGKKAFINFTSNLLENDVATLLPNESIVVELIDEATPDPKMLAACKKLKDLGYRLALGDYRYSESNLSLVEIADIIKVNFFSTGRWEREAIVKRMEHTGVKFLAEKVESKEDFNEALELGYSYFQGYFFSKPSILSGRDIPSFKLTYLKILQEINKPELDYDELEKLIKQDVALSYKLLKFINSLSFGFLTEIRSIKQALSLLGQKGIIQWTSLVALRNIGENKPDELIITAICRAKFCELIAPKVGLKERSSDLFLMGMFSLIDAFLDQPLQSILADLPIAEDIKGALLGEENMFRDIYDLTLAYEQGDWERFSRIASKLDLEEKLGVQSYITALELSNHIFSRKSVQGARIF